MRGLRELFIESLTKDINPKQATAIFNNETGKALWAEVNLDMVLKTFDKVMEEYKEEQKF
ncbi:MAG: hypothetical protein E7211_14355 [Clostridium lundense]|nr:hypothetical protein [Clostridium lundense]